MIARNSFHFGGVVSSRSGKVNHASSPLAACVNQALAHLKQNGQLKKIQQKWLAKATGAPVLR